MKNLFTNVTKAFFALATISLLSITIVSAQYCAFSGSDPSDDHITNVTFAGIDNTSGATGYSDFTSISATVSPGLSYDISGKLGNGGTWTETLTVYIDWDQNNVFDASERYNIGSCTSGACATGITGSIEVPLNAVPGETRMRVIGKFSSAPVGPCSSDGGMTYGEVEDYTVNVLSGECTPPNFTYTVINDCEAENYDVSALLSDFGTSSFITVYLTRSDAVPVNPVTLIFALQGQTVNIINDVPFGVTISATISGANPLCNLTRNFQQKYCLAANDDICGAIILACGDTVTQAYTSGTPSPEGDCADGVTNDLWYTFTAVEGLFYQVSFDGTTYNESSTAEVLVGDDCTGTLIQEIDCTEGILSFYIDSAATYFIRAQPTTSAKETIRISVNCYGGPDNGDCVSATEIDCAGTYTGATTAAPQHDADQPFCGSTAPSIFNTGVWFTYEPEENINMSFSLTGTYNTSLFLYTNSCEDLVCVGGATNILNASLSEGSTYYLYVTGTGNSRGEFVLNTTCTPVDCPEYGNIGGPCDDGDPNTVDAVVTEDCDCVGRIPIPGEVCAAPGGPIEIDQLPYTTTDNTDGYLDDYTYTSATLPPLAPGAITSGTSPFYYFNGDDVVYSYTPSGTEVLNISVSAHGSYAGLFVLTGCPFALIQGYSVTSSATDSLKIHGLTALAGETYYIVISTWATPQTTPYKLDITKLENCEGTPSAGIIDSEDMMVCASSPITLATVGASESASGLLLTWQSSPAGANVWTDITGANSPTYIMAGGITVATDFRFFAECSLSGESDISNVLALTINPVITECYCEASNSYSAAYYISNVSTDGALQDLDRTSGFSSGGYGDYTATDTLIAHANQEFDFSLIFGGSGNTYQFGVWIDLNQNGSFADAGENIISVPTYVSSYDGTIVIPEGLADGSYRMRVRASYIGLPTPCGDNDYAEAEDYIVKIITLNECAGTPNGGTAADDSFSICPTASFDLIVTGATSPASGLERNWQSSPAGANTWSDIVGASNPIYNVQGGISVATDYRYRVTCANSSETAYSNVVEATINTNVTDCYCIPVGTNASYYINNFSTSNGVSNITNLASGFSPGGYGDFTSMTVSQVQTQSVSFTEDFVSGQTAGFRIWVDWNQDGAFDPVTEVVYNSSSYAASQSGSFIVPQSALPGTTRMRVVGHYLSGTGDVAPCASFTYGEFEDYTFNVIQLGTCTGTPSAGVADNDQVMICATAPLTLSVTGASDPATGLVRNWQSSPAGANTWTNITGATASTYILSGGISVATDFRYVVTCENSSETAYSNVIEATINTNVTECYCIPEGTNTSYYINNFTTTNGVSNISNLASGFSPGGYGDFTSMTVSQVQTQSVNFSEDFVGGTAGFRIWVDWNQDGAFDPITEVAYNSSSYGSSQSGSFTVPQSALAGTTRMRVVAHYLSGTGLIDPCASFTYGEFEDYTFNVIALGECAGTPTAGVAANDEIFICATVPITLSVTGASDPATGLVRNWQSSPAGANTWMNIVGATAPTYVLVGGISAATDFRYVVTCTNSNETAYSNVVEATVNTNAADCYCIPEGTNSSYYVNSFATTNGIQNITNTGSGFSAGGYGDFTSMTVEQATGETVNFTGTFVGGTAGFRIWVDWNQDGAFDQVSEVVYNTSTYGGPWSGSFVVPANALPGATRMRIQGDYIASTGFIDPCGSTTWGEFEDYTFVVSSASAVSLNGSVNWNSSCGNRAGTVRLYTPNTATLIETYNITVGATGAFSIENLPTGTYDVIVKVQGYLAKGIQDVVISAGVNTLAVGSIRNGNVNNDNSINLFDLSLINAGFNRSVGHPSYNPLADLNCDGSINLFDISIFNASFNKVGATAPL